MIVGGRGWLFSSDLKIGNDGSFNSKFKMRKTVVFTNKADIRENSSMS